MAATSLTLEIHPRWINANLSPSKHIREFEFRVDADRPKPVFYFLLHMHNKRFFSTLCGLKGHLLYYHKYYKHSPSHLTAGLSKKTSREAFAASRLRLKLKGMRRKGGKKRLREVLTVLTLIGEFNTKSPQNKRFLELPLNFVAPSFQFEISFPNKLLKTALMNSS